MPRDGRVNAPAERALTRAQVAERFAISERHLRDLEEEHGIPVLRFGRAVRYDAAALKALEDLARRPPPEKPEPYRVPKRGPATKYESPEAAYRRALAMLSEVRKPKKVHGSGR